MSNNSNSTNFWTRFANFMQNYFALNPYIITQAEAEQSIREGVSFRGTNLFILVLAIFIASLGLNTNSTAVIIGAMLISPLMGPIIGLGLGVGITDFELIKQSFRNLVIAAIFSVTASCVYFIISPVAEGHSELLARTSPTIYDVLIAIFGGGAGIVAICSKNKGNVIPGVAIATALMPPLCTAGYGLATLQMHYFLGATYLFLINSIFICLATFIGVKYFKFKAKPTDNPARAHRIRSWIYAIAILAILPSIWLTYLMFRQNTFQLNADRFVAQECKWPDTHVLSSTENWNKTGKTINLTLIGKVMPQDSLTLALTSRLKFYGLQGTSIKIFQGDMSSAQANQMQHTSSMKDVFEISQNALAAKQTEIDSLRNIIALDREAMGGAIDILPELKVVFPHIENIAVTRAVFANLKDNRLDTVNVAMVYASDLSHSQRRDLTRYLEARLRTRSIKVVKVDRDIP